MPVLTARQMQAIENLEWLYDPGDTFRASGRSLTMAIALIRVALRYPGQGIGIRDHFSVARRASVAIEAITFTIERMLDDDPLLQGSFLVRAGRLTFNARAIRPLEIDPSTWLPRNWVAPAPARQERNFAVVGGDISNIPPPTPASTPEPQPTLWDYLQDPTF